MHRKTESKFQMENFFIIEKSLSFTTTTTTTTIITIIIITTFRIILEELQNKYQFCHGAMTVA